MLPPGPFVGHFRFRNPLSSVGDPPGRRGYVTTGPICGPLVISSFALKRWGPPQGGGGYVTTGPICGPLLIPYPALKRWRPPGRQGLCYHRAHLWATSDSVPRFQALGTPQAARVMFRLPLCGPRLILSLALKC